MWTEFDEILKGLTNHVVGWTVPIPPELGRFYGRSIDLDFQTREADIDDFFVPRASPPPRPNQLNVLLARRVLSDIPRVLSIVEQEVSKYEAERWDESLIHEPTIWLYDYDAAERWAFVVGRTDWPDYGVHAEFEGLTFVECWGGD
jgi:hypothetical protein